MFLHILADTVGSVGVIVSALMVKYFNLTIVDPLISICIVVLILLSIVPLLKTSSLAFVEASEYGALKALEGKVGRGDGSCGRSKGWWEWRVCIFGG